MGMAFCPHAIAWGDVATWLAGIGSLTAAGTALYIAGSQRRLAERHRAQDAMNRQCANEDRSAILAVVFDHELYQLGGMLNHMVEALSATDYSDEPMQALRWIHVTLPRDPMPMMVRFAGDLGVFERADAGTLMQIISGWNALSVPFFADHFKDAPQSVVVDTVRSLHRSFAALANQIVGGRAVTQKHAAGIRSDLPPTDWPTYVIPAGRLPPTIYKPLDSTR